jgi:hypothetical protein
MAFSQASIPYRALLASVAMKRHLWILGLLASICLAGQTAAWAGQAPGTASDPDIPVSHRDRVYSAEHATGAIRQVVHGEDRIQQRYLVIAEGHPDKPGAVVQVQLK